MIIRIYGFDVETERISKLISENESTAGDPLNNQPTKMLEDQSGYMRVVESN